MKQLKKSHVLQGAALVGNLARVKQILKEEGDKKILLGLRRIAIYNFVKNGFFGAAKEIILQDQMNNFIIKYISGCASGGHNKEIQDILSRIPKTATLKLRDKIIKHAARNGHITIIRSILLGMKGTGEFNSMRAIALKKLAINFWDSQVEEILSQEKNPAILNLLQRRLLIGHAQNMHVETVQKMISSQNRDLKKEWLLIAIKKYAKKGVVNAVREILLSKDPFQLGG